MVSLAQEHFPSDTERHLFGPNFKQRLKLNQWRTNVQPGNLPKVMFLEILQSNIIQNVPPTGRLNHFTPQWMMPTQDPWVLQTIQGHR